MADSSRSWLEWFCNLSILAALAARWTMDLANKRPLDFAVNKLQNSRYEFKYIEEKTTGKCVEGRKARHLERGKDVFQE